MIIKKCKYCGNSNNLLNYIQYDKIVYCNICIACKKNITSHNNPRYWLKKERALETKLKISNSLKGNIPWNKGLIKEVHKSLEIIGLKNSINMKKLWKKIKIKSPSKILKDKIKLFKSPSKISKDEIKLFNLVKNIFPDAISNKPICYKKGKYKWPDITINNLKLLIEYDGHYRHDNIKEDLNRDKILNTLGYRILHFHKFIPNENELKIIIQQFLISDKKYYYLCKNNKW